jgi:hypothetical protein
MKKTRLRESISESAIGPFTYIVLIDALSLIEKGKGIISYMFPKENPEIIRGWFRKLYSADSFKKNKDKLQSISSRFYNNANLIALYKAVNGLKSMNYIESDKENHEESIQRLITKVSGFIKRRLSPDDDEVIEIFLSELNHIAENISEKLQSEVDALAQKEEEIPEPKPEKEETPKVSERMKNKLRKKIKEIVRTHLINNRYK